MLRKAVDYDGICARGIVVVIVMAISFNECSGQDDLNCGRPVSELVECPSYSPAETTRTEQQCINDGCYYCSGTTPSCVEGAGCATINLTPENECKEGLYRVPYRDRCRELGCSWCRGNPGYQCFKNLTSIDDLIVPPLSSSDNCVVDPSLREECDYFIFARPVVRTGCWQSGCHWCPLLPDTGSGPSCIKGQVCLTAKTTPEYDCRKYPTEQLNPMECFKRECSWCSNNAEYNCVRDRPAGLSGPTCQRDSTEYTECPSYPNGASNRNEQQCRDDGCYYCASAPTTCVLGTGCSWIDMTVVNQCTTNTGEAILDKKVCRDHGCSWCEHHSVIKCFKNAASKDQIVSVPPPYPAACAITSAQRVECSYVQPIYAGTVSQCWLSGCHWCPATGESISCIQGEVCASQRTGPEYDCRETPNEVLTPYQCIHRGCSWCANNNDYKCVRNIPDIPLPPCNGSLNCFPFSTDSTGVTEAQCNNEYRCSYCSSATPDKQCMRDECPPGYELRYDRQSCCQSTSSINGQPPIAPNNGGRIINGAAASAGQWPWAAFYAFTDGVIAASCGAFIVAPKRAITAAHCQLRDNDTSEITGPGRGFVVVGATDLSSPLRTQIDVANANPHPWYSERLNVHDVMVLELWHAVPSEITPLSLPMGESPVDGMTCYVAGWGVVDDSALNISQYLLEAPVKIFSNAQCRSFRVIHDENFLICAGGTLSTTCFGDSGGALMCQRCSNCEWYAYGITSFGLPATPPCPPNIPGFYARVDAYQSFFQEHGVPISSQTYTCDSL